MHPVYLLREGEIFPPNSHEDWDYFKVVAPIPADRALPSAGRRQVPARPG